MKNIILIFFFTFTTIFSQNLVIDKIEPPNWWVGHTYDEIQLMVYGKNLDSISVFCDNSGIRITGIINTENSNYAFVNIHIDDKIAAGEYYLRFSNNYGQKIEPYSLLKRVESDKIHNGFSNEDVVYLIFPDRFVNGDETNDLIFNEKEEFEFGSLNGRHGGDIKGIINKLVYLKDLGITTIWNTPLTENNMYMSYHGYAATNLYKIDPRFGTNELYREFVNKAQDLGLKVIMDHVTNHIGINHEWVNNSPTPTWFNGSLEVHLPADHNKTAYVDIYADTKSITNANEGWFVDTMPDLNQRDFLLARYIIQNTIWWIEYSGIDGIREDTYPYADQKFMSIWAKEILTHYPNFNIVGEVWKGDPAILAAFQTNSFFPKEYDSNLPVITDFAIRDALINYMSGKAGISEIYEVLGKDFVYSNPENLLVFFDNHDTDRGMYAVNWNIHKYKVGLTIVLTTRGIPQLFYGTEIGLDGGGHHGRIRGQFPGSFVTNEFNAFTEEGRTNEQNEIYNFTKGLLQLRKEYKVIQTGELKQFPPKDNVYIYLRENDGQKIIFIINDNLGSKEINLNNYISEETSIRKIKDLMEGAYLELNERKIYVNANSISIYLIN